MRRRLALVVVTLGLLVPATAFAAAEPRADVDCQKHGQLTTHYTVAELRQALSQMQLAERDYTSCQVVITDALYRAEGKSVPGQGGGGGGGGAGTIIIIIAAVIILGGGGGAAYWAYRRNNDDAGGDEPPTQAR
jgi:hypothetical protein